MTLKSGPNWVCSDVCMLKCQNQNRQILVLFFQCDYESSRKSSLVCCGVHHCNLWQLKLLLWDWAKALQLLAVHNLHGKRFVLVRKSLAFAWGVCVQEIFELARKVKSSMANHFWNQLHNKNKPCEPHKKNEPFSTHNSNYAFFYLSLEKFMQGFLWTHIHLYRSTVDSTMKSSTL